MPNPINWVATAVVTLLDWLSLEEEEIDMDDEEEFEDESERYDHEPL